MRERTIRVHVGDATTTVLVSILIDVAMGCIVLERQMNIDFAVFAGDHTTAFVVVDCR